ncbi:hypothetical protein NAP1_09647 [Erythrobacter sp. NAP1]|uniref:acyl-CoA dehydrogenase family protein n=1 Tax=Erythrobacter sp. NAP1 TaxID=237727 RepID=UPI00006851DC|nr:acyl-CoA dehydrogenase family protein [Erythrobacter sp. NAP1]EAQ27848.1 hypothetical protein NAP1_09647 [Erythrobacter sp. NAP1]
MAGGMEAGDLQMIGEGLERILADAPLEAIDHAGGVGEDMNALWQTLYENGYPLLCANEEHGGMGGSLGDAAFVASITARHALAAPLADTVLAIGILSACGIEPAVYRIAISDPLNEGAPLAHSTQSDAVLVFKDGRLRLEPHSPGQVEPLKGAEDGAAPRGSRIEAMEDIAAPNWLTAEAFHALAALVRSAQMAGAMQAVLDLTLTYTSEREQFGRPLSKFQAIQHHLSDIACETAASIAAVEIASDALAADPHCGARTIEEIAIAKIRCGQAAARVAAGAHQAHGAMGFTREYKLGRYTRRLWQWQDEFGSESEWAIRLGHAVLAEDEPALWPRISAPL